MRMARQSAGHGAGGFLSHADTVDSPDGGGDHAAAQGVQAARRSAERADIGDFEQVPFRWNRDVL
jgi:hypothetical protein